MSLLLGTQFNIEAGIQILDHILWGCSWLHESGLQALLLAGDPGEDWSILSKPEWFGSHKAAKSGSMLPAPTMVDNTPVLFCYF